jgi:hypothetical protein
MTLTGAAAALLLVMLFAAAPAAEAGLLRGVQEVVSGVLQVPLSTLAGTFQGPPVAGTLFGAVNGLFSGLGLVTSGALNLAGGALGLAKSVAPLLLPFLF